MGRMPHSLIAGLVVKTAGRATSRGQVKERRKWPQTKIWSKAKTHPSHNKGSNSKNNHLLLMTFQRKTSQEVTEKTERGL